MKQYIYWLIMIAVLCIPCHAETLSLESLSMVDGKPARPRRTISYTPEGIKVTYSITEVEIEEDPNFPDRYFIKIPGFVPKMSWRDDITYAYPQIKPSFIVPPNSDISVSIDNYEYIDLPLLLTYGEVDKFEDEDVSAFIPSHAPYDDKEFYPESPVELVGVSGRGDCSIAEIVIAPAMFDTYNQTTRVLTNFTFTIHSSVPFDYPELEKAAQADRVDGICYRSKRDLLPTPANNNTPATRENESILIITVPEYKEAARMLASWKKTCGYNVVVKTEKSWTPTSVISEVEKTYKKYPDLKYLIILGDHQDVPGMQSKFDDADHVTDYYYGFVNNKDKKPKLYRGRISVSKAEEALNTVYKIISTEKNPPSDKKYYNSYINAAFFNSLADDPSQEEKSQYVTTSEKVYDYLKSLNKDVDRIYFSYDPYMPSKFYDGRTLPDELDPMNYDWVQTSDSVIKSINEGKGIILHRDHGYVDVWMQPYFGTKHLDSLKNYRKYPLLFNINCKSGRFNEVSFAEAMLKQKDAGSIGVIAATNETPNQSNNRLTLGIYNAIWPDPGIPYNGGKDTLITTPASRTVEIMEKGLNYMAFFDDYSEKYQREIYHYFGDPSMIFYREMPDSIKVEIDKSAGALRISLDKYADISALNLNDSTIEQRFNRKYTEFSDKQQWAILISGNRIRPIFLEYAPNLNIYVQNEEISSDRYYWGKEIFLGNNVTENIPEGSVEIREGCLNIEANEVVFDPGFEVCSGASMNVTPIPITGN